jgi:hypothetical protein
MVTSNNINPFLDYDYWINNRNRKGEYCSVPTRSEAIRNLLLATGVPDLATLYSINMECQVNVGQDGGEPVAGEFKGKRWKGWSDGISTWKPFRIPYNAAKEPIYEDVNISFDLAKHAEAIGMTGWDWKNKVSRWVAYDFDAITGHSDRHTKKLENEELQKIINLVRDIPWVTLRKSTSGKGLHLYVFISDSPSIENHNEHAALARAILAKLSALVGFDFNSKVDICGGNMWVWHRKQKGTDGLTIIKNGVPLTDIPSTWRDHVKVVSGHKKRVNPEFIEKVGEDKFDELSGQNPRIPLDEDHKKLINYLKEKSDSCWWWDSDRHMLVTHTYNLKEAFKDLGLKGVYDTMSQGTERGHDHNCYMFPIKRGAWVVRRFSPGCAEHESWMQDPAGWTKCYFNRDPDLHTAARTYGGVELPDNKGFQFNEVENAKKALQHLGVNIEIEAAYAMRPAILKQQKDGRVVFEFENKQDPAGTLKGWAAVKNKWQRVFSTNSVGQEIETSNYDDLIRHLVSDIDRKNAGWVVCCDERWHEEPLSHIEAILKSESVKPNEIDIVIGNCVKRAWKLVNKPFEVEYPGNREWNRDAARLRYIPTDYTESLHFPHWKMILNHVGKNINDAVKENPWCKANAITTGADYLKCWIASLFQFPTEPLPYLFLFGPQDCGKSILHESLELLMTKGCVRADTTLSNDSGFNGELFNAVLCVVEETDLSKAKHAYNRIKDWVTSKLLSVHIKKSTPFMAPNSTHWIQCANDQKACPVFQGDTRITMIRVDELDPMELIPKAKLIEKLELEAPEFLSEIMNIELPTPISRLNIPVLETTEKFNLQNNSVTLLNKFIDECCFEYDGQTTTFSKFYEMFQEWLPSEERTFWTTVRVSREFPTKYPKGKHVSNVTTIGNLSFEKPPEGFKPNKRWTLNQKGYFQEVAL